MKDGQSWCMNVLFPSLNREIMFPDVDEDVFRIDKTKSCRCRVLDVLPGKFQKPTGDIAKILALNVHFNLNIAHILLNDENLPSA